MAESEKKESFKKSIVEKNIIELKTNFIPKGLVPLERLFNNNDVFLKPNSNTEGESIIDCNIGTINEPKFFKISRLLLEEAKTRYVNLLK